CPIVGVRGGGGIVPHRWCQGGGIVPHRWCQWGRNSAPSLVSVGRRNSAPSFGVSGEEE
ncbi:unnamed protein product, partial [Staurois parvus]